MQISLKDLLVIVAFCAGVAWCASQTGFDDWAFWFVVAVSAVMSSLFVRMARNPTRRRSALRATVPIAVLSFFLALLTIFANAILLTTAALILSSRPLPSIRTLCYVAMSCALVSLTLGVLPGIVEVRKLRAMRQEFPIVSLANRLKYEKVKSSPVSPRDVFLDSAVANQLSEMEEGLDHGNYREVLFHIIHGEERERFVRSMGFGAMRMIRPTPSSLRQPPLQDIEFDDVVVVDNPDSQRDGWHAFWKAGKSNNIEHLHIISRNDFLDPNAFGAIIEAPLGVAGFIAHGLHYPPTASMDETMWKIQRLELVSLLKFDEPRVYVLDHLPRMDQLSNDSIPTRPLDDFESAALPQLSTEKDVVVEGQGSDYLMLGSLRAAKQCLDCHNAKRGELLGAFSYSIHRGSASDGE